MVGLEDEAPPYNSNRDFVPVQEEEHEPQFGVLSQEASESHRIRQHSGNEVVYEDDFQEPEDYWEPDRDSGSDFNHYDERCIEYDPNEDYLNDKELEEAFWMDFTRLYEEGYGRDHTNSKTTGLKNIETKRTSSLGETEKGKDMDGSPRSGNEREVSEAPTLLQLEGQNDGNVNVEGDKGKDKGNTTNDNGRHVIVLGEDVGRGSKNDSAGVDHAGDQYAKMNGYESSDAAYLFFPKLTIPDIGSVFDEIMRESAFRLGPYGKIIFKLDQTHDSVVS